MTDAAPCKARVAGAENMIVSAQEQAVTALASIYGGSASEFGTAYPMIGMPVLPMGTNAMPAGLINPAGIGMSALRIRSELDTSDYSEDVLLDSGSNKHYLKSNRWFTSEEPTNMIITGIGEHTVKAKSCGPWAGTLADEHGNIFNFHSFGTYVPDNKFTLLSVAQIVHGGNAVIHDGDPVTGKHGLILKNKAGGRQFIPFTFCKATGLWWLRIYKNPFAYNFHMMSGGSTSGTINDTGIGNHTSMQAITEPTAVGNEHESKEAGAATT
eukprot:1438465-Rhodomonas_salina.1